jgi:hypothetical protein
MCAQDQQIGRFGRCDNLIKYSTCFNAGDRLSGNLSADVCNPLIECTSGIIDELGFEIGRCSG